MATKSTQKHREWGLVIAGILLIILACMVLYWPGASMVTLAIFVGAMFLFAGGADLSKWARARGEHTGSGWILASALIDFVLGALFILYPVVGAATIPWIAGSFFVAYGIVGCIASFGMRKVEKAWFALLALGIVAIVMGILFFFDMGSFVICLAFLLAFRGATLIAFGFAGWEPQI